MTETIPSEAREAARRLGELFQRDSELAKLQDNALGRLRAANQQLWTGLHPEALSLLYDHTEAVGIRDHARIRSRITAIIADTRAAGGDDHEIETAVLRAVQEIHWTIHRATIDYQTACEDRRHLAADIGEHSQRMIAALQAAGWTRDEAQRADVTKLRSLNSSLTAQSAPALQVAQVSFHAICR